MKYALPATKHTKRVEIVHSAVIGETTLWFFRW
jgi:hypothetical protein